jgi:Tfp pilus assembly major pilin PilA
MDKSKGSNSIGTMIGAIIVVIILLAGAYYFYQKGIERQKNFQALLDSAKQTATVPGEIVTTEISTTTKK